MKVLHITGYMFLITILSISLPVYGSAENGAPSPAASSSNGGPAAPLFNLSTGLLFHRPLPAASSTERFPGLRRRPYTAADAIAQLRTCSLPSESAPGVSPAICEEFEEQKELLTMELSDLQENIRKRQTKIEDLTTDELRRYYTMVNEANTPKLADLKNAVEQELIKYNHYGTNANKFADFFAQYNVSVVDRIALLAGYEAALNNAAMFGIPFGVVETQEYIQNITPEFIRVTRPEYQGKIRVVDMSDKVRQQPEGNTCGYHALFNASMIYDWVKASAPARLPLVDKLAEGPDIAFCKDALAQLSSASADQNYENIFDDEIEKLIEKAVFGLDAQHITIIASADQLQEAFFGGLGSIFAEIYKDIPTVVEQLHNEHGFAHAFIIGTAGAQGAGHWFVAVAHNEFGKITLYVADSQANKEYGRAYCPRSDKIQILLNVLNAGPEQLKQALIQ